MAGNSPNKKSPAAQLKTANGSVNRKPPVAPPAYCPQPAPKVLQTKRPLGQTRQAGQPGRPIARPAYRQQPKPDAAQLKTIGTSQTKTHPAAPPTYRPQPTPRVLQRKMFVSREQNEQHGAQKPVAPPVYKPQPMPKVMQAKMTESRRLAVRSKEGVKRSAAPPVYRPQSAPKCLQMKTRNQQTQAGAQGPKPIVSPALTVGTVVQPSWGLIKKVIRAAADFEREREKQYDERWRPRVIEMPWPVGPAPDPDPDPPAGNKNGDNKESKDDDSEDGEFFHFDESGKPIRNTKAELTEKQKRQWDEAVNKWNTEKQKNKPLKPKKGRRNKKGSPPGHPAEEPVEEEQKVATHVPMPIPGGQFSVNIFFAQHHSLTKSSGKDGDARRKNKPLAIVEGIYNGRYAEIHVHFNDPVGTHTGAHVKCDGAYPVDWPEGAVAPDLLAILNRIHGDKWKDARNYVAEK